jgi:hypothetical protein
MLREDNTFVYIVLGLIAIILVGSALFYGTIGYIVLHFVHKLW